MVLGRARHCGRCGDLERQLRDLRLEGGVLGHQPVRLDDLRLVEQAGLAQPRGRPAELLGHVCERLECALALRRAAHTGVVRLGVAQHERLGHRDASGGGQASEDALAHSSSRSARSSAATISAVEVAPGSWWPMLRSPR